MRVLLIRHGETDATKKRIYCGHSDPCLNREGVAQGEDLKKKLRNIVVNKIYASDLIRARDFAGLIFNTSVIETSTEIREMNFGIFEGLTHEELMSDHNGLYTRWIDDPGKTDIPGGETILAFKSRVIGFYEKVLNCDRTIAFVTHAGPIRVILADLTGADDIGPIKIDTAGISVVDYKDSNVIVRTINDTNYQEDGKKWSKH